jgi:hypothetical protein
VRPPTTHPNAEVADYLADYFSASEACADLPWLDDILTGVLALRTDGDSRTRSLSRKVLFLVLQRCQVISTKHVGTALGGRYQPRTVERYASLARVASLATAARLPRAGAAPGSVLAAREELDAPFLLNAAAAEAASLHQPASEHSAAQPFDPLQARRGHRCMPPPVARRRELRLLVGGMEFP